MLKNKKIFDEILRDKEALLDLAKHRKARYAFNVLKRTAAKW